MIDFDSVPDDLKDVAWEVYDEYYSEMERTFPDADLNRGNRMSAHPQIKRLLKIGQLCQKYEWSPRAYVRFAFEQAGGGVPVSLSDLLDTKLCTKYAEHCVNQQNSGSAEARWAYQEREFRLMLRAKHMYKGPVDVLHAAFAPFDPWFRVLRLYPIPDSLNERYGDSAHIELAANPEARRLARQYCPAAYKAFIDYHGPAGPEDRK